MKQRRFRISSNRDYKIEIFDCRNKLITVIRDSGYNNKEHILNDAAIKSIGPRTPRYVCISCEETGQSGMYLINGKKIL